MDYYSHAIEQGKYTYTIVYIDTIPTIFIVDMPKIKWQNSKDLQFQVNKILPHKPKIQAIISRTDTEHKTIQFTLMLELPNDTKLTHFKK